MKTCTVIARAWNSNEYSDEIRYAVIHLSAEYVRKLLSLRGLWQTCAAQASNLSEIRLWDGSADWYARCPDLSGLLDLGGDDARSILNDNGLVTVGSSDEFAQALRDQHGARTEIEEVVVSSSGVEWTCSPKHGNDVVKSGEVTWGRLAEILDYLQPETQEAAR